VDPVPAVAGQVQDDPAGRVLVGVADVEDVAGVDLEPAHLAGPVERHDTQPGAVLVAPGVGHPRTQLERHGQVEEHRVVLGDREVVHHRRPGHVDRRARHELPVGREPVVGDIRRREAVAEEVQLARGRVGLRVRGHRGGELSVEVDGTHGLELPRDLVREPALDEGQQPARVLDDVRVGDDGRAVDGAVLGDEGLAGQCARAHPAVAVPLGAPLAQPHAVQHPVAGEPVPRVLPR
jgi:hypothetical protein